MKIHQSAFIWELIIKKKLTNYNANVIPIKVGLFIKITDPKNYKKVNFYTYQKLIRKLMYFSYNTKANIVFVIKPLSRHNTDLKKSYLQVTKRIVRNLKGIMNIDLIFSWEIANHLLKKLPPYGLVKYLDSNFARDLENWKSVISYYFFLNRVVKSKKPSPPWQSKPSI